VVPEAVGRWLRADAAGDSEWIARESEHSVPCQDLAAMGWKRFVRPGFFYCSSGVSAAEAALDLRGLNSVGHDHPATRQQRKVSEVMKEVGEMVGLEER
jgi:hypothetical protein